METCPLCCEAKPDTAMCLLSNCSHQKTCLECMKKWIVKAETAGHKSHADCPFCRKEIGAEENLSILGRPFQPAQRTVTTTIADDLTLQWLQEQTQPCPSCGARIEKEANTCNNMECLCGYRFCFACGAQGAQCSCTPGDHYFWDNVLDQRAQYLAPPSANADTETGLVDLGQHIQKRKRQELQFRVRNQRLAHPEQLRREERQLDEATSSARWLYGSKTCWGSLRIMQQQAQRETVREKRRSNSMKRQWECLYMDNMAPTWLFAQNSIKVLEQMTGATKVQRQRQVQRRDYEDYPVVSVVTAVDAAICLGAWLFADKDCGGLLQHFFEQANNAEDLFYFGEVCMDYGDCQPGCRNCGCVPTEEDERENTSNLRLLFVTEEQRIMEKAEMANDWMD